MALALEEEGVTVQVPIGAELIQSPGEAACEAFCPHCKRAELSSLSSGSLGVHAGGWIHSSL